MPIASRVQLRPSVLNGMCQPEWEGNLGENIHMHMYG